MAFFENLQLSNQRQQSGYPFDRASSLEVGTHVFPANWITSLDIVVTSAVFPLYVSQIRARESSVYMEIEDAAGEHICDLVFSPEKSSVRDINGIISGQIEAVPQLYPWLVRLIEGTVYGMLTLKTTDLILSSDVITCAHFIGFRSMSVNGVPRGDNVTLNFERNVEVVCQGSRNVQLNVYGDYSYAYENGTRLWKVNGVQLKDKNLVIKHKALSDLRVLTKQNNVQLIGVTDAS